MVWVLKRCKAILSVGALNSITDADSSKMNHFPTNRGLKARSDWRACRVKVDVKWLGLAWQKVKIEAKLRHPSKTQNQTISKTHLTCLTFQENSTARAVSVICSAAKALCRGRA